MAVWGIGGPRREKNKKSLFWYLTFVVICGYNIRMKTNPTNTTYNYRQCVSTYAAYNAVTHVYVCDVWQDETTLLWNANNGVIFMWDFPTREMAVNAIEVYA